MDTERLFLQLVRLGIGHGGSLPLTAGWLSAEVEWDVVKALADRQGLTALVLDGLERLQVQGFKVQESMPKKVRLQWIGEVLGNYEARYKAYEEAISSLAHLFNSHGLKMMVLKGYACSLDWPKPDHRPTGDIDIWQFWQWREADALVANVNDYDNENHKGIEIDNSHHHHTVYDWEGFMVENHYDFINTHAHRSSRKLEKIFKELGKDDSNFVEVMGERVYLPSANLHALFLVRHMAAHFAGAEITLRQVLDWAFFVEKHGKDVDWKWLEGQLDRFHMKDFCRCINAICVEDLGFANLNDNQDIFHLPSDLIHLKERVLGDILCPEFQGTEPRGFFARVVFKWKRWQANAWKQRLCYPESRLSTFWSGVWNHLLKPKSI